jgi:AcrR family transcriptional regulator
MALLWSPRDKQIGRSGYTIADFVRTAIKLADEEGGGALSIRNIAGRLGIRPMAMYSVLRGKQDLVALMVDESYGTTYPEADSPRGVDWRIGMRDIAQANFALHERHPWLSELLRARPFMGPNEARKFELELKVLDDLGLSDREMEQVLRLLHGHVIQACRLNFNLQRERRQTGVEDAEWWQQAMPVLQKVYDPEHFPLLLRVAAASRSTRNSRSGTHAAFEFGVDRIIEGVETLLQSRRHRRQPKAKR